MNDAVPAGAIGYAVYRGNAGKIVFRPHGRPESSKNYGADINTLVELLEFGRL